MMRHDATIPHNPRAQRPTPQPHHPARSVTPWRYLHTVPERHDEKLDAALWAMLKQNLGPKAIIEALARDECGIGYPVDLARSTFYDRKRKLIRRHGPPEAVVDKGEEDAAVDAIRREALGAIRATARKLNLKQQQGTLTKDEAGTLSVCLKTVDDYERRRRDKSALERRQLETVEKREGAPSTLTGRLARQMASSNAATSDDDASADDGGDSVARSREPADAQLVST